MRWEKKSLYILNNALMTTKSKSHFMIFFGNPIIFQPYTLYLGKILTTTRHHGFHIGITSHGLYKWAKDPVGRFNYVEQYFDIVIHFKLLSSKPWISYWHYLPWTLQMGKRSYGQI